MTGFAGGTGLAGGAVPIGPWHLALATLFVLLVGLLSLRMSLGLGKDLLIGTVRTYLQLIAIGLVLRVVFHISSPWLVLGILTLMIALAARIVVQRSPNDAPRGIFVASSFAMALTGFLITFTVTGLIVRVRPWYEPHYVIPLAGMILGNSMNGIALAIERVLSDLESRSSELLALAALGATPREAAHASIRGALRAGLIPTINGMAAAGLVSLPGMMSGQILAGADPVVATGYQIVVMLMIAAATALGSVTAVMLLYHRRFTKEGVYLERGFRADH